MDQAKLISRPDKYNLPSLPTGPALLAEDGELLLDEDGNTLYQD